VVQQEDILNSLDDLEAPTPATDSSSSSLGNNNCNNGTAVESEMETDENVIVVETTGIQPATGTDADADDAADTNDANDAAADTTDTDVHTAVFDVEEDGCDAGYLVLRGGTAEQQTQQQQQRKVPNCCAICLGPYDVGEVVVWSSNAACKHAFHQECMVDWLCKMQDSTPCPCCRQEFTDLETYRKEKKMLPRDTFNPQLVRL
jgi:hypothetical protein